MNALEFEYQANLARARRSERKRVVLLQFVPNMVIVVLAIASVCVDALESHRVAELLKLLLTLTLVASLGLLRYVTNATECGRGCRLARVWLVVVVGIAAAGDYSCPSLVIGASVACLLGLGAVVRRLSERWCARRNARLVRAWERRLESDASDVVHR